MNIVGDIKNNIGIYRIVNTTNNIRKCYIGSAVNLHRRYKLHEWRLRKGIHENSKLQRAFNKYGEDNFIFEIIENCEKDKLIEREQFYIDVHDSVKKGYNINPTAGNRLGSKLSEESKRKIGDKSRLKIYSDEYKKKIAEGLKLAVKEGRRISTHAPLSEEHKRKLSIAFFGDRNHFFGKHHTEEVKNKIRETNKISSSGGNNPKAIPIELYDLQYNLITTYPSGRELVDAVGCNMYDYKNYRQGKCKTLKGKYYVKDIIK